MNRLKRVLLRLRRISPQHFIADVLVIVASAFLALYLRVGAENYERFFDALKMYLPVIVLIRFLCMFSFGCYSVMWRYISTVDAARLARAIALSVAIVMAVTVLVPVRVQS